MKNQTLSHPFFRTPVLLLVMALALPRLAFAQAGAGNPVAGDEAMRVVIQVNTASSEDDMVALSGSTPCLIKLSAPAAEDLTITLVNPATAPTPHRLSFGHASIPASQDGTLTLTLPKNGDAVAFSIGGLTKSQEVEDATIEAHKDGATGEVKGNAAASVYWFDPYLVVASGGNYGWTANKSQYTVITGNGRAVDIAAHAGLKPTGLSHNAPQLAGLQMGIIQNATATRTISYEADPSGFTWVEPDALTRAGQIKPTSLSVTYNQFEGRSISIPGPLLDSESNATYFYDPPVPISQEVIRTDDTPEVVYQAEFTRGLSNGGVIVASVPYKVNKITMNDSYTTWMTLGHPSIGQADPPIVRQASWNLIADSSIIASPQKAKTYVDTQATSKPVIVGPVANQSIVQGASTSSGTQITRTYP